MPGSGSEEVANAGRQEIRTDSSTNRLSAQWCQLFSWQSKQKTDEPIRKPIRDKQIATESPQLNPAKPGPNLVLAPGRIRD